MGRGPGSEQPLRSAIELLPYRGTSAGGGYSAVGDLVRFAAALAGGAVLDSSMVATATAGKVAGTRPGLRYGFGFEDVTVASGARRYGHGGGAPGMNGVLWIYPDAQLVIAVLANLDPPAADEVARFIEHRLSGVYLPR